MGLSRSRFSRDRRSVLASLGQQGGALRHVYSETELQQAITAAVSSTVTTTALGEVGVAAMRIIIAAPIKFTKTVKIPSTTFGLTIEAASRGAYVWASTDIGAFFDVDGLDVTIRDIYELSSTTVTAFARMSPTLTNLGNDFTLSGCHITSCTNLFIRPVAASGTLSRARILNNSAANAAIDVDSVVDSHVHGNQVASITLRGGADNSIIGNNGATIDTSGTAGSNTVYGNTNGVYTNVDVADKPATPTDHNS